MSKPIVKKHIDEYAIETGQIFVCTHGGLCARGKTHAEAFNKLRDHFKFLSGARPVPTMTRMF